MSQITPPTTDINQIKREICPMCGCTDYGNHVCPSESNVPSRPTDISQIKEGGVKMKPELRGFGLKTTTGRGTCSTVPSPTDISQIIEQLKKWKTPENLGDDYFELADWQVKNRDTDSQLYNDGFEEALDKVITYLESLKGK